MFIDDTNFRWKNKLNLSRGHMKKMECILVKLLKKITSINANNNLVEKQLLCRIKISAKWII